MRVHTFSTRIRNSFLLIYGSTQHKLQGPEIKNFSILDLIFKDKIRKFKS